MSQVHFVRIGHDLETGGPAEIGDIARRSGLYILGSSGTGKTNLLLHLMDQDIRHGHGVFFLDPHGDAIDDLVGRHSSYEAIREGEGLVAAALHTHSSFRLLNPTNPAFTFGINLLACRDVASRDERRNTYNRAYSVFRKLWEAEWDERIWLRTIVQHTLYAFIENQGFTLADVPMFLDPANTSFREYIVRNMRHNSQVADFWLTQYGAKREIDQQRQVDAARTRVQELLADPDVRDIVGQRETTLDFAAIMQKGIVLLVKFPPTLAPDSARFIGTILMSELRHAVEISCPKGSRRQFCVFVDEFQHFARSEDFETLFDEARKYGVATTIAHQHRSGQLAENRGIAGATDAAGNKILFRLSDEDAKEFSLEFAKPPPAEIRLEQQLVISQEPFADLLRGHSNPQIREFVNRYLRRLQERVEDIPDMIELERMQRTRYLDDASASRITEQLERVQLGSRIRAAQALMRADTALALARAQTAQIELLYWRHSRYRNTIRFLNTTLAAIMEGHVRPGHDEFSQLLMACVSASSRIPEAYVDTLHLYISLMYGNPTTPRAARFTFAQAHALLARDRETLQRQITDESQQHIDSYAQTRRDNARAGFDTFLTDRRILQQGRREWVERELAEWRLDTRVYRWEPGDGSYDGSLNELIVSYIPLLAYPDVYALMRPYFSSRLTPSWDRLISVHIDGYVEALRRERNERPAADERSSVSPGWHLFLDWFRDRRSPEVVSLRIEDHDSVDFSDELKAAFYDFVARYGGGAYATLATLTAARYPPTHWRNYRDFKTDPYAQSWHPRQPFPCWTNRPYPLPRSWDRLSMRLHYERYPGYNTLYLPALVEYEPLHVLGLLEELCSLLEGRDFPRDFGRFYWIGRRHWRYDKQRWEPFFNSPGNPYSKLGERSESGLILASNTYRRGALQEALEWGYEVTNEYERYSHGGGRYKLREGKREDLQFLINQMYGQSLDRSLHGLADHNPLVVRYLQLRACDIARYGEKIADITFPQPTLQHTSSSKVSDVVHGMIKILQKALTEQDERDKQEVYSTLMERAQRDIDEYAAKQVVTIPEHLPARALTASEIEELKEACLHELYKGAAEGWNVNGTLRVLDEFVELCTLLSKPENHIKVPSGQYLEKPVYTRPVHDMAAEMAQELMNLPPTVAYAKTIQVGAGETGVKKQKVKIRPPPPEPEWAGELNNFIRGLPRAERIRAQTNKGMTSLPPIRAKSWSEFISEVLEWRTFHDGFCKAREKIEEEIRGRQERWRRQAALEKPQASRRRGRGRRRLPPRRGSEGPDEPPPTHF